MLGVWYAAVGRAFARDEDVDDLAVAGRRLAEDDRRELPTVSPRAVAQFTPDVVAGGTQRPNGPRQAVLVGDGEELPAASHGRPCQDRRCQHDHGEKADGNGPHETMLAHIPPFAAPQCRAPAGAQRYFFVCPLNTALGSLFSAWRWQRAPESPSRRERSTSSSP